MKNNENVEEELRQNIQMIYERISRKRKCDFIEIFYMLFKYNMFKNREKFKILVM